MKPRPRFALLALTVGACSARVPPGPTALPVAGSDLSTVVVVSTPPTASLYVATLGSRWDPIDHPGMNWEVLNRLYAAPVEVEVGRDGAWLRVPCPTHDGSCVEALAGPMLAPPWHDLPERPLPSIEDHLASILFEAHPYQHPTAGWPERPPISKERALQHWISALAPAAMHAITPDDASTQRLRDALHTLPPRPLPDPAIKAPRRPRGVEVVFIPTTEDTARWSIGTAVPRHPNEVTLHAPLPPPEHPTVRCLRDVATRVLPTPDKLTFGPDLHHAAFMAFSAPTEADDARAILAVLPQIWSTLSADGPESCENIGYASVVVTWPQAIEQPTDDDVQGMGYAFIYRPRPAGVQR
jgi:hypothetical protein